MEFPRFATVRQTVPTAPLPDVTQAVRETLRHAEVGARLRPGARIAVGAGSRGIADYAVVVKAIVAELKALGAQPFVFPAMGSHGGATAEGQREVLVEQGITEATMGCPVVSSMDVVPVGMTATGMPVFCDAAAHASDGIIVVNRVKIHTDFHGPTESGLTKMLAIGLGKREGAEPLHVRGVAGLRDDIPHVAAVQIANSPILCGVAIIEDGAHNVARVQAVPADKIAVVEPELLAYARTLLARLPVDASDVLIVDQIGKDISGAGMDNNVVGRMFIDGQPEPETPRIGTIVALRLTAASHGNATGIGFADIASQRLLDAIDHEITRVNMATSGFMRRGQIPPAFPTDALAIAAAFERSGRGAAASALRIRDTLSLGVLQVSENLLPTVLERSNVELVSPAESLVFDEGGWLI